MNSEEELYQRIEDYLTGHPDSQGLGMERQLDPILDHKIRLMQTAREMILENRLREVRSLARQAHLQRPFRPGGWLWGLIGLECLLLISCLGILLKQTPETPITQDNKTALPKLEQKSIAQFQTNALRTENTPSVKSVLPKNSSEGEVLLPANVDKTSVGEANETPITPTPAGITESKPEPKETSASNPCENEPLKMTYNAMPSCAGQANGSLHLKMLTGQAPYRYELTHHNGESFNAIGPLPAGIYHLKVMDQRGCTYIVPTLEIQAKACTESFAFNPFVGETWLAPEAGHLTILDQAGNTYYEKDLPLGNTEGWDGYSLRGELKTGYFIFTIHRQQELIRQGHITIVH